MDPYALGGISAQFMKDTPYAWYLIAASFVMITFLLLRQQRRRNGNASPRQYRREIDAATHQGTGIRRDMERLLVELNELARQINAQIDTKFAKLEQSIADADKRISALRILIEAADKARSDPAPAGVGETAESSPERKTPSAERPRHLDIRVGDEGVAGRMASPGRSEDLRETEEVGGRKQGTADGVHGPAATSEPTDASRLRIYALADAGRSTVEIAKELHEHVGEVELILNLRQGDGAKK